MCLCMSDVWDVMTRLTVHAQLYELLCMYTQNCTDYAMYMLGASHRRLLDLPEMFEVAFVVCFPTLI